ncbi:serine/threonine-protein kinase [Cellulomonas oligotrophica]|uniref:non-specific serine/threonine protein kinase n=1 Tax=Cellulomonas oligotrophica TaxID=931536 RepID=A0A7Y9FG18_9CELL|nr:serine/threonine-protein kinase [Cellulomonas oligotrophica]NYD86681.1 serine/threonine-protein kinase [Cellulomonas oligotrophica]
MRTTHGVALGDGRYRLLRRIAVGGMGEVWEAKDDALARPVAVKVLREEYAGDAGFLERFRTEARNSAALSHPNIAALFDYGEQDGSAYLVMELVVGEPLSDLLEREPVLKPRALVPILAQSARGLHAAHVAGVVHRDVKPGNILLARQGKVKITDFGVSLATDQKTMTATGMVMGTAQYLSPEQAVGKAATPLSDLYSLGVVAYEAMAGHRPFTGPTAVDIAVAHVNDPVPPLPSHADKKLGALVMRLLSKEPTERPASGEELAELLDRMAPRTPAGGIPVFTSTPRRAADGRRGEPAGRKPEGAPAPVAGRPAAPHPGDPVPPSYQPSTRRERAGRGEPSRPSGRRAAPPVSGGAHRASQQGPPRSWRDRLPREVGVGGYRVRLPVAVLILVLVTLLGALLADRMIGADGPAGTSMTPTAATVTVTRPVVLPCGTSDQYPRARWSDGMICPEQAQAAAGSDQVGRTWADARAPRATEVKDA